MSFALARARSEKGEDTNSSAFARSYNNSVSINNLTGFLASFQSHLSPKIDKAAALPRTPSHIRFNFERITPQPKLKISRPGDEYEKGADQAAERIMGRAIVADSSRTMQPSKIEEIDRSYFGHKIKENGGGLSNVLTKHTDNYKNNRYSKTGIQSIIAEKALQSQAEPLDKTTRENMELRFGYDFSKVRIHNNETAADSAESLGAKAYAVGNDIVFGKDRYSPDTMDGIRLLVHELSHVIQQSGPDYDSKISEPNTNLELDAKRAANIYLSSQDEIHVIRDGIKRISCDEDEDNFKKRVKLATSSEREPISSTSVLEEQQTSSESGWRTDIINDENKRARLALKGAPFPQPSDFSLENLPKATEKALLKTETPQYKMERAREYAEKKRQSEYDAELLKEGLKEAEIDKEVEKVLPGNWAMTPVLGAAMRSEAHFSHGNYGRGIFHAGMALSDFAAVKSLALGTGKLLLKSSVAKKWVPLIATKVFTGLTDAAPIVAGNLADRAASPLVSLVESAVASPAAPNVVGNLAERAAIPFVESAVASPAAPNVVGNLAARAASAPVITSQIASRPTLIGTSTRHMRREALRIIRNNINHPLRFLLDQSLRFHRTRGLKHSELADRDDLVQMGHISSNKLGGQQRVMLQGAWENQYSNVTVEGSKGRGSSVLDNPIVDVGGLPVSLQTARRWVEDGRIRPEDVGEVISP